MFLIRHNVSMGNITIGAATHTLSNTNEPLSWRTHPHPCTHTLPHSAISPEHTHTHKHACTHTDTTLNGDTDLWITKVKVMSLCWFEIASFERNLTLASVCYFPHDYRQRVAGVSFPLSPNIDLLHSNTI